MSRATLGWIVLGWVGFALLPWYGFDRNAVPTLADGEDWRSVRDASPDIEALATRGSAFERLDQLALEHLYGVR